MIIIDDKEEFPMKEYIVVLAIFAISLGICHAINADIGYVEAFKLALE